MTHGGQRAGPRPRRRARTVALWAGLAVLGAVGVGGAWRLRPPAPFTFSWPAGNVYTYRVAFEVAGSVAPPGPGEAGAQDALSAALALDATLELRSYGRLGEAGDWVLGARLAQVDRLDWTLGQVPLVADGGQALVGPEVTLVLAPDGAFRTLYAPADAPPALVNLFRQVLAPLEVVVTSGARTWTWEQTNQVGDVRVAYEARAARPERLAVTRRPVQYTRLAAGPVVGVTSAVPTGESEAELDRAGHLDRVAGWEDVSVTALGGAPLFHQRTRVDARLASVRKAPIATAAPARLAGLVPSGLGEVSASPDSQRESLEQRAAGATFEGLVRQLLVHGSASTFPGLGAWMWQATGFFRLHPERCRDLEEVFTSPALNELGRGRVLDVLASTGTPQAQAVLRDLLDTPAAKGAGSYPLYVQRLSLVETPTPETVEYLRAKVERGDGAHTLAAAHALGAVIGRRARAGEVDERSAAVLRAGLAAARTERDKADWLGALGNAGLEGDAPVLATYAADDAPLVRGAAADALRKVQTPAAEQVLLGLTGDPDATVQARALHALGAYPLAADDFAVLGQQVASGQLQPRSYGSLVLLLERQREPRPAVLLVLDAMVGRGVENQRLLLRIRALRQALSATN